jgi:hypothetical protein
VNHEQHKQQEEYMARWEYKVVFVEEWRRISVEGQEARPEQGERNSAFARRFLNGMGADGWELSAVQHSMPGRSYLIFKRLMADSAEPDLSVVQRPEEQPQPAGPVVSV